MPHSRSAFDIQDARCRIARSAGGGRIQQPQVRVPGDHPELWLEQAERRDRCTQVDGPQELMLHIARHRVQVFPGRFFLAAAVADHQRRLRMPRLEDQRAPVPRGKGIAEPASLLAGISAGRAKPASSLADCGPRRVSPSQPALRLPPAWRRDAVVARRPGARWAASRRWRPLARTIRAGRYREKRLHVVAELPGRRKARQNWVLCPIAPVAFSKDSAPKTLELLTAEGAPGHHKGNAGARFQVQLAAAREEVGREVLVRGKPAALPDSQLLRLSAEAPWDARDMKR